MYTGISCRIPDHGPSRGHSIITVRRRHHVFLMWIDGGSAPRIHHNRNILGLLGPAAKQGEVAGCRHRIVLGGIRPSICGTGHTRRLAPYPIPRASSGGGKTPRSRLAAGNGEDRGPSWGMAGSASLPWWSSGVVAICTGDHPHIFYGHFLDAG